MKDVITCQLITARGNNETSWWVLDALSSVQSFQQMDISFKYELMNLSKLIILMVVTCSDI